MNAETLSFQEIILALATMPQLTKQLSGKGKKYDVVINEVLKYDPDAESSHLPNSKELQATTGLSASKCKDFLEEIYSDFLRQIQGEDSSREINKVKCEFYVDCFNKSVRFYARLPIAPRIGDDIRLSFLRPIFRIDTFSIEAVQHVLRSDEQILEITLSAGPFNSYERFMDDKAKAENKYNWKKGRRDDKSKWFDE